jgi:glycosyltransferase involved in cell wall biosynthesis
MQDLLKTKNLSYLTISIIIPTYNRAAKIKLTIDSFLEQDYDNRAYQIIVCNNNSTDSTENLIKQYVKDYPEQIIYLEEPRQGVHYARNSAAKIARGDILYFTDDDMIAKPNLLSEIVKVFEFDSQVASATGRVLPKWEIDPPEWVKQLCYNGLLSLNDPPEDFIVSKNDCNVFSCHQAIRREVFFQSGGFNPENTAGEWIGDGETGLNLKIKELGYKFGYNGKSIIYHIIPAQRMTQAYLNKRLGNQGNCDSYTDYRKYIYSSLKLWLINIKFVIKSILLIPKILKSLILQKSDWRIKLGYIFYYEYRIKYNIKLITQSSWRELVLKTNWIE